MKKKVVHLLSSNEYSGAENIAINIIKLLEKDYEFTYVSPQGLIENFLEKRNIKYLPLKGNSIGSLNSMLNELKPDIIHAHDFRASIKIAFSPYKCKKISHLHQNPSWIRGVNLKSLLYLISCFKLDKIITVSPEILEEAIFTKAIKEKSFVLVNNVDTQSVVAAAGKPITSSKFDLAFVGRLTEAKNPLKFIMIVNEIAKKKEEIRAVMVGDGDLRLDCERLILSLGLSKNIKMTGFLSNPFAIMNSSKMLVITSKWEGFGLVAVEAMALGKPVIATPVGGLNTIVNSNCGKLCNSNDEFISTILNVLDNKAYYSKLSNGARENIIKFSDKKRWTHIIKKIYNDF